MSSVQWMAAFLLVTPLPAFASRSEVPREAWLNQFRTSFPNAVCEKRSFFRRCFKLTEDECLSEALRAVKTCVLESQDRIPPKLAMPADGKTWGVQLGGCAGTAFESSLALLQKKIDGPDCARKP